MIRQIVKINSEKCNGCGLCADACHEGAIVIQNGKAVLVRDDYCDGLGNCLPVCPTGAITFEDREAVAYDAQAVENRKKDGKSACPSSAIKNLETTQTKLPCGCPSTSATTFDRSEKKPPCGCPSTSATTFDRSESEDTTVKYQPKAHTSELRQFPIQLKLVPPNAPYFNNCDLLIAADCTAFAYGNFHNDFIKGKITLIGCPKLDEGDYSEKLTEILERNEINSLTVVRMEVPCCGGIVQAVKTALRNSGKIVPWSIVNISRGGEILN